MERKLFSLPATVLVFSAAVWVWNQPVQAALAASAGTCCSSIRKASVLIAADQPPAGPCRSARNAARGGTNANIAWPPRRRRTRPPPRTNRPFPCRINRKAMTPGTKRPRTGLRPPTAAILPGPLRFLRPGRMKWPHLRVRKSIRHRRRTCRNSRPPAMLPPDPVTPAKLKPINPARAGIYTSGKWRYQMQITSPGTRSEGRWGWLSYDDQKLPRGEINDYYDTPWGPMYWVDVPTTAWGVHGWMPVPLAQNRRQGRPLVLPVSISTPPSSSGVAVPAKPRVQTLEINKSHNGQLAKLRVGNVLVIRLPGDPATGYQWQAASTNSPAVRHDRAATVLASRTDRHSGGAQDVHVYVSGRPAGNRFDPPLLRPSR